MNWFGVFAAAAAVFTGMIIVKNIPERSNDPIAPAATEVSVTEQAVSENESSLITDVSSEKQKAPAVTVIETVISEIPGVSEKTGVTETSAEEKKVSDNAVSTVNEAVSGKNENTDPSAYPYPEDIRVDHAKVTKNSDGTLRVTLDYGRFAITLPSYWEGHFVITENKFCAKIAHNNSHDGKLFSYQISNFSNEEEMFDAGFRNIPEWVSLRGASGDRYLQTVRVSDMRYSEEDEAESAEYRSLENDDMFRALSNTESLSEESGRMEKIMHLPDSEYFKAHIERPYNYQTDEQRAGEAVKYFAYGDDYVLNGAAQEEEWKLEEGWIITVKRAFQTDDGLFYDCYSENGDHYWVSAEDITFENAAGH